MLHGGCPSWLSSFRMRKLAPLLLPNVSRQLPSPATPPLNRTCQRLTVSPDGGSLSLSDMLVSHAPLLMGISLGRARCFPLPSRLRCHKRVGSVGFPLRYSPGSFDVHWLSGRWCTPSPCTAALLSRGRRVSPASPLHLYLSLTASSWPRTLLSWQAHHPWSGPVISRVPKRLPSACSSTTVLLPQECCERRSFLPAVDSFHCWLMSLAANSPCCRCRRCLSRQTALAVTPADVLAATLAQVHTLSHSFDCLAQSGQKEATWQTPSYLGTPTIKSQ